MRLLFLSLPTIENVTAVVYPAINSLPLSTLSTVAEDDVTSRAPVTTVKV
jgi:hypothetical protein